MITTDTPVYDHHTVEDIPVVPDTAMQLVLPKPGEPVVALQIREGVELHKDGAWWDGHVTQKGTFIMGSDPDDVYPNDETKSFYVAAPGPIPEGYSEVLAAVMASADPSSFVGDPVLMTKTRGVELIGYAAVEGKLQTAEGVVDFKSGDAIVRSLDRADRVWRVEPGVFAKKYEV